MAASKSRSRMSGPKKAVAKKSAAKKAAGKKAAATRQRRTAAKKALITRKAKAVGANAAKAAELDARIAIVRNNLRSLVDQAASVTGASSEELMSSRIAQQEAELERLRKERDAL
jgi:hypothetical protein